MQPYTTQRKTSPNLAEENFEQAPSASPDECAAKLSPARSIPHPENDSALCWAIYRSFRGELNTDLGNEGSQQRARIRLT